jgi:hypothetical protein
MSEYTDKITNDYLNKINNLNENKKKVIFNLIDIFTEKEFIKNEYDITKNNNKDNQQNNNKDNQQNNNTQQVNNTGENTNSKENSGFSLFGGKKKSDYNIFMKKELERLKKIHPNKDHKERFKEAAKNWKNK